MIQGTEFWLNLICTSNHMFGRTILGKLPERIFESFEIARTNKFSKIMWVICPKNCQNRTCDYWLITPNQQTLCFETNTF